MTALELILLSKERGYSVMGVLSTAYFFFFFLSLSLGTSLPYSLLFTDPTKSKETVQLSTGCCIVKFYKSNNPFSFMAS